jgi:hypothetical protein
MMTTLSNTRHERFAQELAKGKSQEQAYIEAGYKPDRGAASRLSANVNIQSRVANLQERGAIKAEIAIGDILAELEEARTLAKAEGQSAAMVAATMGKAKLLGLGAPNRNQFSGLSNLPLTVTYVVPAKAVDVAYFGYDTGDET